MNFTIDESYLTEIIDRKVYSFLNNPENPTKEDLVKILKNHHQMVSIGSKDHPEFTRLREQLEKAGYIKIERGWWNGDSVLKPFKLNNFKFKKGDKFMCASALGSYLKFIREYKK